MAVDCDEYLVQVPFVPGLGPASVQTCRVCGAELHRSLPDGLVGDDHTAREHLLLDVAEAQREAVVPPHVVGDDLRRVAESPVGHRIRVQ